MTSKNIGIIHVDRHADIQETDLDERMHTTPYFHATNIPNVPAKNLVQIGIGGWQVGLWVVLYWYTFEIWWYKCQGAPDRQHVYDRLQEGTVV